MTIVSSGNEIRMQGTSDVNPRQLYGSASNYIVPGSTNLSINRGTQFSELGEVFYQTEGVLSGTLYAYKTAQTTTFSLSGGGNSFTISRGFDDTNSRHTGQTGYYNFSFPGLADWTGSTPEDIQGGTSWNTNDYGLTLNSDTSALGNIGSSTYTGGNSKNFTITHLGWFENADSNYPNGNDLDTQQEGNWLWFTIRDDDNNSISDDDDAFYSIEINGQEFKRADAYETYQQVISPTFDSNTSGSTSYYHRNWIWVVTDTQLSNIGQNTNSKNFYVNSGPKLNTGIAEQFGGADSSDVKLGDYLKGAGAGYIPSSHSSSNIKATPTGPTDGFNAKFSDYYGTTTEGSVIHSTTFIPTYSTFVFTRSGFMTNSSSLNHGSMTDNTFPNSSSISFGGRTRAVGDLKIRQMFCSPNGQNIDFSIKIEEDNTTQTFSNSGFSRIRIYDASSATGTPLIDVARTDATFTAQTFTNSCRGSWLWTINNASINDFFGTDTTNNGTHFLQIIE